MMAKTRKPSRLDALTETNLELMQKRKKRPKAPKPIEPSKDAWNYYHKELKSLVRAMTSRLIAELEPAMKRLKPDYTADSLYTRDGWVDEILSAIRSVSRLFTSELFDAQARRVAASTISRADAANSDEFRDSMNKAVGIDFQLITRSKGISDYLDASVAENVNLIKSIPEEYFKEVETIVLAGMKNGKAPTAIARQIQEEAGVSYRRAKLIARDQTAKLNGDLTRKRQEAAGIEFYKVRTANDRRVSGDPSGKYPNAKISCYAIARQDVGYGVGIYKLSEGASWRGETGLHPGRHHVLCRCVGQAMIPGVNYFPEKGKK